MDMWVSWGLALFTSKSFSLTITANVTTALHKACNPHPQRLCRCLLQR